MENVGTLSLDNVILKWGENKQSYWGSTIEELPGTVESVEMNNVHIIDPPSRHPLE